MSKVTIEDISRQTGLSRGTVSRALNDRPDISEQTKQRVLTACQQLNYVPSQAARSLATGRSYAVTVVVDHLAAPLPSAFLRGVISRAAAANYTVNVVELGSDPELRQQRMNHLVRERVDSILLAASLDTSLANILTEEYGKHPIASLTPIESVSADVFETDQTESGRLVGRHLMQKADQEVLYIHAGTSPFATHRLDGIREVFGNANLDLDKTIVEIRANADHGTLWQTLSPRMEQIRAIGCTDDTLAIRVMMAAIRSGRMPGQDIAIMGQGNERVGEFLRPSLTTIDFTGEETGRRAMDVVLQRLGKSRMDAVQHTTIAPTLIDRESTRLNA